MAADWSNTKSKVWTGRRPARQVSDLVSAVLDPVMAKRAGVSLDLIANWDEIAGPAHAGHSRPERIDWPGSKQVSGTLVIACPAHRTLYVQHDSDGIIARINAHYGFAAVARLRIVQGAVSRPAPSTRRPARPLTPTDRASVEQGVATIENEELRAALARLGNGVFSAGSARKSHD